MSEVAFDASMYFRFGRTARAGITARTCFEAVASRERTSTTRFEEDGRTQFARWKALRPGDRVRIWSGPCRQGVFTGESCIIEVTELPIEVSLGSIDRGAWSRAEGWAPEYIDFLRSRGRERGVQIRYRLHRAPAPSAQAVLDL